MYTNAYLYTVHINTYLHTLHMNISKYIDTYVHTDKLM